MWQNVQVGDVVRIKRNEFFPADLLLMHSSGTNGVCYVETKNLDGESNLKLKHAVKELDNFYKEEADI
jgi:phospholipid-translocating ATPase